MTGSAKLTVMLVSDLASQYCVSYKLISEFQVYFAGTI